MADTNEEKDKAETANGKSASVSNSGISDDTTTNLIAFGIWGSILFYVFIWNNIPLNKNGGLENLYRIGVLAGVLVIGIIVLLVAGRRKNKIVEETGNFFLLIFIVLGAAIFSVYFIGQEQALIFKLFVIAYFSFLPAWLYLDFISKKGRTLWEEYVFNLYRLRIDNVANLPKPPVHSKYYKKWKIAHEGNENPPPTIYQKKFEGLFGVVVPDEKQSDGKNVFSVFRGENLWPVAMATLLISVGWVLITEPESIFNKSAFPVFISNSKPVLPLETLRFAFLGSYFYVVQMLVRRYFQNDLKTSAYISCTLRFIVVTLIVWALDTAWGSGIAQSQRSLLAFIIGIFPEVGWEAIKALVKFPIKNLLLPGLKQKFPLNELDGLNIWYESRLLEEGIEDMQNLATSNLVDVMLNTRIPVERLVDWVDQSILYLHLGDGEAEDSKKARATVRKYGIRTATDLEDAFLISTIAQTKSGEGPIVSDTPEEKFIAQLERILNNDDNEPSILRAIQYTFKSEPNLEHVRNWRAYDAEEEVTRAE